MFYLIKIIFILNLINYGLCQIEINKNNFNNIINSKTKPNYYKLENSENIIKKINEIYSNVVNINRNDIDDIFEKIRQNSSDNVLSSKKHNNDDYNDELCQNQLSYFVESLNNTEMWAVQLFDSWGKIPAGLMYGNTKEFGNFDQCMQFSYETGIESIGLIEPQYCFAEMIVVPDIDPEQIPFLYLWLGTCVPKVCRPQMIKEFYSLVGFTVGAFVGETDQHSLCVRKGDDDIKYDAADIIAIIFLCMVCTALIASTIYDIYTTKHNIHKNQLWLSFSIIINSRRLFSTEKHKSPDMLDCLHGIRVLAIIWIIAGHSYTILLSFPLLNANYVSDWIGNLFSQILIFSTIAVDTFLLLSGLLVTWSVFKEMKRREKLINIPLMYVHRYLRITPSVAILLLLTVSLFRYVTSGPLRTMNIESATDSCEEYWWSTLLHLQNYVNPTKLCLPHIWYLSVDTQLFLLSPLVLIPLWKWREKALPGVITLIVFSMGIVFVIFYNNNFNLTLFRRSLDYNSVLYYPTHTRMAAWFIGVLSGYVIFFTREIKIRLPTWVVVSGWVVSITSMLAVLFGPYDFNQPDHEINLLEHTFYETFSRVAWCLSLSWIIFACVKGYGGFFNSFLSMGFWLPFSRLSFAMYLLHPMYQLFRLSAIRSHVTFNDWNNMHLFHGDLNMTILFSIVWVLAFEIPITNLEKIIFKRT